MYWHLIKCFFSRTKIMNYFQEFNKTISMINGKLARGIQSQEMRRISVKLKNTNNASSKVKTH